MQQARLAEAERKKVNEARRMAKERRLALTTPRWEALINSPEFSIGMIRTDMGLRRLWFEGIPGHLRGRAWAMAIGNPLAMSRGQRARLL